MALQTAEKLAQLQYTQVGYMLRKLYLEPARAIFALERSQLHNALCGSTSMSGMTRRRMFPGFSI